jgi:serine/threonine-protein kinase RsbT
MDHPALIEGNDGDLRKLVLPIRASEDMVLVRTAVRKVALEINLGLVDRTKLVTAASEIARNTLEYGKGGEMTVERLLASKRGVRLTFVDEGPGILDIKKAMTDGYTSGTGLGLGLGGSRRLVDEFEIVSEVNKGTRVTLTKWTR